MNTKIFLCLICSLLANVSAQTSADKPASIPAQKETTRVKKVGVEEFDKLRASKENVILDVRTESEYKAGHIPGSVNLDINSPDFDQKIGKLEKNKTYLVHCAAGGRSARACKKLETVGFSS